jgi:hypothetical protein
MSYVWLPVDVNLYQNHKTARLARYLGCSKVHAVGHMVCLWSWACVHAPDGNLSHLEAEDVATVADWDGDLSAFLPALMRAGFIDENLVLHDWEEHQGSQFRKRLYEAEKKRKHRDNTGTDGGQDRDNIGTQGYDRTGQDRTIEEEEDALVSIALSELPSSESTREEYKRTIDRYRSRLSDAHIERIILQLADWKPTRPRAQLHRTLAVWLNKEPPDEHITTEPHYESPPVPDDW